MIISRTPMRISLMGGGSDMAAYYLNGYGAVVSTTIDRYIYITVNRRFDDLIRVSYSKTEVVEHPDKLEHNIIREALKMVGVEQGVDIVYMGDIPLSNVGVGLGSSSSLAAGVLNALYAYTGQHVSAEHLARRACQLEIDILGHPIGKQDQYAAAYGGFNYIRFNMDESVFVTPIICKKETRQELNSRFLLFYTGITRMSSDVLHEQQANIATNRERLDRLVDMAEMMRDLLIRNEFRMIGELLHESWEHKKKLASNVTNSRLDDYYDRALAAGAVGGKLVGAGGGGFLLLYCEEPYQDHVRQALGDLKECPFTFEPQGSRIIYVSD